MFFDLWKITTLHGLMLNAHFKQIRFLEWVKTNPVPLNSNLNYLTNAREIALLGVKGSNPTFNSSYDNGIYNYPICHSKDRCHPTQKPTKLIEDILAKHSKPGEVVLDCFSGGASTAEACWNLGREFIGAEIDPEYHSQSLNRLLRLCIPVIGEMKS